MKIIISPSKTMKIGEPSILKEQKLVYPKKNKELLTKLQKYNKTEIQKIMKINNHLLEETYFNLQNFLQLPSFKAFDAFYGLVYKGLQKDLYQTKEYTYIEDKVIILDAFYGIILPGNIIKKYRLDLKMKIGINLYTFWDLNDYFNDELIINLASREFSQLITTKKMVNISFLQHRDNRYVNLATYSKQARGKFLNYLILNKITTVSEMYNFTDDNYAFNSRLSNDFELVFTREN